MYATIEADIENGVIKGYDASRLPSHAHVLITFLREAPKNRPAHAAKTARGSLHRYADKTLVEQEQVAWPSFAREKHEQG
jgi:hypothetical protein